MPQTDHGDASWAIEEMVVDVGASPDTVLMQTDDVRYVLDQLDKLPKREAMVLRMRFGLDDEEPRTLKDIGRRLGLTRERVRQIERDALSLLSQRMEAN